MSNTLKINAKQYTKEIVISCYYTCHCSCIDPLMNWHTLWTLFGFIVNSNDVNLFLAKTHFLVLTVVQVQQVQGHIDFNQH